MTEKELINMLKENSALTKKYWIQLFENYNREDVEYAQKMAREISHLYFGNKIYLRGLIEFSNYCKNDCYYCGIRKSCKNVSRYRLSNEEILKCCYEGYNLGFRTFVLQSGEEENAINNNIIYLITAIKEKYPDCAITLSLGEKSHKVYENFFKAGADRYLLRHETANFEHYKKLHPKDMSLETRKECLYDLKEIGFQVGCGFMVGSPYQTTECLADDMVFISEFKPAMVGIGPFIPHDDTPFKSMNTGSYELTLFLLSLTRIMLKSVLLPSTTALGTAHPSGREKGILSGANVVMPNLSPKIVRDKYKLYNNKISTGEEAAESVGLLKNKMSSIGYEIITSRGDWQGFTKETRK